MLLACLKKFYQFLLGWTGNHNSDFDETFHSSSLSGEETVVSIFSSGNLSFRENQPMKFEILTFSPAGRKFTQFFCAKLKTRSYILLKLSTAPYCQDRNLLCQFFVQSIYLWDKRNQWNLKFWPSGLLKGNWANFFVLNWKLGFRFCWKFPQLYTVRTGNQCVHFLLKQFLF